MTSLDKYQDGRRRGTAHIDFVSRDSVVAAQASAAQTPIELDGRKLRLEDSEGHTKPADPSSKLFYKGYSGPESEIRTIFEQYGDCIASIQQCMLFTLILYQQLTISNIE